MIWKQRKNTSLTGRVADGDPAVCTVGNGGEMRRSMLAKYSGSRFWYSIYGWRLKLRYHSIVFCCSLHMQTKMLADRVVTELNAARLRGGPRDIHSHCPLPRWSMKHHMHRFLCTSSPRSPFRVIHLFFTQLRTIQMPQNFHILAKITEPPAPRTRKYSHPQVTTSLNRIDRKFTRVYLGSPKFRGAAAPTVDYHALVLKLQA